jgi:uncharacterized membrane protein YdjX (TVP38/TMEM64 family)
MSQLISKKQLIVSAIVLFVILLFWLSAALYDYFFEAISFIEGHASEFPVLAVLIFVGLSTLSVMLFSFSSVWLVPIAIGLWGSFYTFFLLLSGWVLGNVFSYGIGRYLGKPLISRLASQEKVDKYKEIFLGNNAGFVLVFLTRIVLPSEIPGYALGILRYNFSKYLIASILSELPYVILTVYAIDAVLRRDFLLFSVWGIVWLFFSTVLVRLVYQKIQKAGLIKRVEEA